MEEGFITPKTWSGTQFRPSDKQLRHIFNKLHFSHPLNYPSHLLMLKSHRAFSAVKQKGRSKWTAKKQPRSPQSLTGTETAIVPKNWSTATQSYVNKQDFFPQLFRKHLALLAMCMCVLKKCSQMARMWRDFVVCTEWDRKAQGRSQLDHSTHRQGSWWCQLPPAQWNGKNTAFAATKADFSVILHENPRQNFISSEVLPGATDSRAQHKNTF